MKEVVEQMYIPTSLLPLAKNLSFCFSFTDDDAISLSDLLSTSAVNKMFSPATYPVLGSLTVAVIGPLAQQKQFSVLSLLRTTGS